MGKDAENAALKHPPRTTKAPETAYLAGTISSFAEVIRMRVGYIGLGNMGGPMSAHLAPGGFETTVFDLSGAALEAAVATGANAAASPFDVGASSEIVCICVQTDAQVRSVIVGDGEGTGVLAGLSEGGVILIHSTVSPETIEAMHAAAEQHGCSVVDAAVTGGAAGAKAGELVFMVGGEDETIERIRPVLDVSSKLVIHAGPRGSGVKLKLVVNLFQYIHFAAVREAFALAEVTGLDHEDLIAATRANGHLSDGEMQFVGSARLPQDTQLPEEVQAFMKTQLITAEKDLGHALDQARAAGLALPTASVVSAGMARIYRVDDASRR
ncbi:MAG: NAD(P)-dependent oxidoreductase [Myxococcota bacterium]